jgi:hypothetical protein
MIVRCGGEEQPHPSEECSQCKRDEQIAFH